MIQHVSYVPKIWDALSKAPQSENKPSQRRKKNTLESYSSKKRPQLSDPLLGQIIDVRI